jgi:hypothetical protein
MNASRFQSSALNLTEKNDIVYVAFSKHQFYLRAHISSFVLHQGQTPVSPFMNFDYNLSDLIDRDYIRVANNTLLHKCDELWVFGPVSDGVLVEIHLARKLGKPVRYFRITRAQRFEEVAASDVELEDVSAWMWDRELSGQDIERWHPRLRFHKTYPLVYPAYSKRSFYWQTHISLYCLNRKTVPLNPFMLFRYFLGDSVPRDTVYRANNNIVRIADEVWTFGEIADGVLGEVVLKRRAGGEVKFFEIAANNPVRFRQMQAKSAVFEKPELERFRSELTA